MAPSQPPPVLVLRHVPHESLGALEPAFQRQGVPFRYVDLFAEPLPPVDPRQLPGLVVLGGPMNVDQTQQYPFLRPEVELVARTIAAGVPTLGICLGSQLMAKALGARVYANRVKEIGWAALRRMPQAHDDPLLGLLNPSEVVFQWHGDTFDLPAGAVWLAASDDCPHQAFRFGSRAYALQFHLEVNAAIIDQWLTEPENCCEVAALRYINPGQIRGQTPLHLPRLEQLAAACCDRFVSWCRG